MISPQSGASLTKRCSRCGQQYPYNEAHVCTAAGESRAAASTASQPAPAESSRVEDESDPVLGAVLGDRYRMQKRLSQGGMGVVYKARHVLLDSPVAVKILLQPQDPVAQQRFLQEAKLASAVKHPNTVYISDFGVLSDGRSYLVMELLRGPTLSRVIADGALDTLRACRIALQIANGLQAVHSHGIVHRDLKPENIFLVDQDGTKDFVKIVDFGIARRSQLVPSSDPNLSTSGARGVTSDPPTPISQPPVSISQPPLTDDSSGSGSRLTMAGTIMGTPHYMSPEQAVGGEIDARSDQYALGCIVYEMLTGSVPFDGAAQAILAKHVTRPVPALHERRPVRMDPVPSAVEKILLKLLAKEPEQRFANMREVSKALQREIDALLLARGERVLMGKSAAEVLTSGRSPRVVTLFGRYVPLWLLLVPSLLLVTLGGVVAYRQFVLKRAPSDRLAEGELLAARERARGFLRIQLSQGPASSRAALLAACGSTHDPALRSTLEALLASPDADVQAQAASALGQLGERAAVPALRQLLGQSSQAAVKIAAAGALDQLGQAEGGRHLQQALSSDDSAARQRAAYLLAEQGDRTAQDLLSAVAAASDVPEEQLIRILARLAQAGDPSARTQLRERLLVPGRREHKLLAAAKLAQLGDEKGREFLHNLATQPGPDQLPAARLLATPEDPVGLPLFRSVVSDRHATAAARELACEGLGQAGTALDVRLLVPLLPQDGVVGGAESGLAVLRSAALSILHIASRQPSTLSEQSMAWARLALDDSDWVVRQSAAAVLGDSASDKATALLAKLVHDPEARVRRSAVRALARRGDHAAWLALRDGVSDADGSVRSETLQAMGRLGQALRRVGVSGLLSEAQTWVRELVERGSAQEQLLSASLLLRLGDTSQRERLLGFQLSQSVEIRKLLVEQVDGESEVLISALADESPAVRMAAARRLAERGDRRAIPVLSEAMKRGGPMASAAYALLRRLGEKAVQAADGELLALGAPLEQRLAAIEALGQAPSDVALPLLRRAAREREPEVRRAVLDTLAVQAAAGSANSPALQSLLRSLAEDHDPAVKAQAAALLARLLAPPAVGTPSDKAQPEAGVERPSAASTDRDKNTAAGSTAAAAQAVAAPGVLPDAAQPSADAKKETSSEAQSEPKASETTSTPTKSAAAQAHDLAESGERSLAAKDYDRAQRSLEKARKLCSKPERNSGCDALLFDVSFQLARMHEAQGHLAEAMQEFQRAVKQAPSVSGKDRDKAAVQDAVLRLVPRLGILIMPKKTGRSCQEVSLWMQPGTHEVVVDGQAQTVQIRAHQTVRAGSCP